MRRQRGFTLVEMLVTITIFLLVVPAIVSAISLTQRTTNAVNRETMIRQGLRNQMDLMILDIRKARAFFSPANVTLSQISGITDALSGLVLPNGISDASAAPEIVLPARGSALAFMLYERSATLSGQSADVYRLVCYYLKRPRASDVDYDSSNSNALSLRRFQSAKSYVDNTGFGSNQHSAATAAGLVEWTPPPPSAVATLPTGSITGSSRLLTNAIAPGGAWVRGMRVPNPGGFFVVRDGGSIALHVIGYAAGKTYYLQSQTIARNYF